MLQRVRCCVCLLILLAGPQLLLSQETQPLLAITHVHVVPMDRERVLTDQTVLIVGNHIARIGPADKVKVPKTADLVDGIGKYLLPGLADMHVHETDEAMLPIYLDNGITTVVNMNGSPPVLALRDKIRKGLVTGPNLYTTGPLLAGEGVMWRNKVVIKTPEDARRTVKEQVQAGYDFLKIYEGLSKENYEEIARTAHALGGRMIGHVPDDVGLEGVLRAHQEAVHHVGGVIWGYFWPDLDVARIPDAVRKMREAHAYFCPTFAIYRTFAKQVSDQQSLLARPEMIYISPETLAWWKQATPKVDTTYRLFDYFGRRLIRAMEDGGVPILVGTDNTNPFVVPGFSIHDELAALVDAGLSPYEAISGATRLSSEFLRNDGGTILVGKRADLLLLERNPLDDVANLKNLKGIVLHGRWISKDDLDAMLDPVKGTI